MIPNKLSNPKSRRPINNFLAGIFVVSLVVGCATTPKRYDQVKEGQWKTKVLVKDRVNNKQHIVNLDVNAVKRQKLRLDATTPAGMHLASLTLSGKKVEYILPREKKFYKGNSSAGSMKALVSVPIEPELIHNIIFDLPISNKEWSCTKDAKGYLAECTRDKDGLNITWLDRKETSKLVKVDHKKAQLQMNFVQFEPKLRKSNKNLFSLRAPKGYKVLRAR